MGNIDLRCEAKFLRSVKILSLYILGAYYATQSTDSLNPRFAWFYFIQSISWLREYRALQLNKMAIVFIAIFAVTFDTSIAFS